MQVHVAAPDVDDEREPRFDRRDVRKVLLGADAEVDAVGRQRRLQRRDDTLKRVLVREQVVGSEIAVGLGQIFDELPVLLVCQLSGDRACRKAASVRVEEHAPAHDDAGEDGGELAPMSGRSHWPMNPFANSMNRSTSATLLTMPSETRTAPVLLPSMQRRKSSIVRCVSCSGWRKQDESSVPVRPSATSPPPGLQKQPVRSEMFALLASSSTRL